MWDHRQNFSIQQTEISCKLDKTNIEFLLPENHINGMPEFARYKTIIFIINCNLNTYVGT